MFLFIARHGLSETNSGHWQTPESELGEIGKRQSIALGKRLRSYKIDHIFSSPWERARKTAEIVSKEVGINFDTLDFVHERRQSSKIYGSSLHSTTSIEFIKEYQKHMRDLNWKFDKEEESINEVLKRGSKLLSFLSKDYYNKRILVVTHDMFIRCLISIVILGSEYTNYSMGHAVKTMYVNNTGLSLLIYDKQHNSWRIKYINNYSHLSKINGE